MSRKSILVVDDEKSQREILEMILSDEGYDAGDGEFGRSGDEICYQVFVSLL